MQGARLVLNDIEESLAREAADAIRTSKGVCIPMAGDASDREFIQAMVDTAVSEFGTIDIAVANAGITLFGDFFEYQPEDFNRVMQVNLAGSFFLAQRAAQQMKNQGTGGSILFMSSVTGHQAHKNLSAYGMSKFAVRALAEALHDEVASEGVAVTLLSPGFVVSDIGRVDNQGQRHEDDASRAPAWIRMPTDEAARQIVAAIETRRREAIITTHGRVGVFLYRHAPWLVQAAVRASRRRSKRSETGGTAS